ncbi:MAG: peptidase, partial [Nitrosopumilus sp.]
YYYPGIGNFGNEFEISSSGQAMLRLRILAENTGNEVISLKCTGPSICSYDVWDGSKAFKYAGMDFVSGQIPINPGTSVIFNMMFGPNIGYGGNQFEYDSSKNYTFRVNESFGSIDIPLKIE